MFYGGWLVVLVLVSILAFYFTFGPVKLHERPSGRLMRRFSTVDQVVHWSVAISFCVLGLSGLIMFFGKHVLLPVIGYTLFGWLTALVQEPAQLRRAAVHRLGHRHGGAVRPAQPAEVL
jgi:formate dehydrogenase subunit gamma